MTRGLPIPLGLLALVSCSGPAYLNRDIIRVAVLPPWNDTSMVEASDKLWPNVEHEATKHRYRILPRAQVEAYFKNLRFGTPEEIQQLKPQKICTDLQVQGLVYSRITSWGKSSSLTGFSIGVECDIWLTEGSTGEQVWAVSGQAGKKGRDSLTGLLNSASALVGDPADYAPKAVANAFKTVPLAGFEPRGD